MDERYQLRQILYETPRRTELFIVMTMCVSSLRPPLTRRRYNEDEELFTRTMHGVLKNIVHLCSRTKSKTWGSEGWKKVRRGRTSLELTRGARSSSASSPTVG